MPSTMNLIVAVTVDDYQIDVSIVVMVTVEVMNLDQIIRSEVELTSSASPLLLLKK